MMVDGVLDGARYSVAVGPDGVKGSVRVARLVEQYKGRQVKAGPTGPMVTVDPGDARSLLALLAAKTRVTGVDGAAVVDAAPRRPGVVH